MAAKGKRSLPTAPKGQKAQERLWAAQSGLDALRRAEQVRKDPKLLSDVKALAKQEQDALRRITGRGS